MAMMEIPLSAVPFQVVNAIVNGQSYQVTVRQLGDSLFSSVVCDGESVTDSVAAVANGPLIPWAQTIAQTQLYWYDSQGSDRPNYEGLGDRWRLVFEELEDE